MALRDFLQTFNTNISPKDVYRIDPVNYFSVKIEYETGNSDADSNGETDVNHNKIFGFSRDYDITPFIQSIELPTISVVGDAAADTIVGVLQTHKMYITPAEQTFRVSFINTKFPLIENWLYPWLREITNPEWNYDNFPFTKAKFTIDMTEHNNVKYILNGCRPTSLPPLAATHELTSKLTREATFTFDYFWVEVSDKSSTDKNALIGLVKKAAKTIGL